MRHDAFSDNNGPATLAPFATGLASAWQALCGLPATHPWFWLARSAQPETLPLLFLVLLDGLSGLLGGAGPGIFRVACGHG